MDARQLDSEKNSHNCLCSMSASLRRENAHQRNDRECVTAYYRTLAADYRTGKRPLMISSNPGHPPSHDDLGR